MITLAVLISLIIYILYKGIPNLKPSLFAWNYNTENVSMMPAIINTLSITAMTLLFSVPAGIFAAIYLVEYAKRGNKFVSVVRMTTETLAGIPSIVFGLFGYLFFNIYLKWGYSILGGALTLSIMVLPLILRTTEEALRSVSDTYREGSFGLGAGKLRTVFRIVLPSAVPGDSGRGHSCHRAYRRGNGGSALSRRHSAAGGRWAVFLGAHAGGTHVCPLE